jgi:hydrogenase maturation protease
MKILILGIGNVLYADEGIGVHFARYLENNYSFTHPEHSVTFMDGGTLAQGLIPLVIQYDHIVIVDTVNVPTAPYGEVYFFNYEKAPQEIDWQGSAHEVEMHQTLVMMDMVGDRPETYVLGVTPRVLESMSFSLSDEIYAAVPVMEKAILQHLNSLGIQIERTHDYPIDYKIFDSFKH